MRTVWGDGNIRNLDHGDGCKPYTFTKKHLFVHLQWVCPVVFTLYLDKAFNKKYMICEIRDRDMRV